MTSRINQPDTSADQELCACLDQVPPQSFIMTAGAGSGKTTSLVKALDHLSRSAGSRMRKRGQQIACITYTEIAAEQVWGDVGNAPLFHVSTIHSFLWSLVHPFTSDIREWVRGRIEEKIDAAREKIAKPKTHAATKLKLQADLQRYANQLEAIGGLDKFAYGMGSNHAEGVLGHDDVLRIGPALIRDNSLMRQLIADRYPYVFIDESQDTDPDVVDAFRLIAVSHPDRFCLGFFGDPMQKIYLSGVGEIAPEHGWVEITKPENFRCPLRVLDVVNRVRAGGDGLKQTRGRKEEVDGHLVPVQGSAQIYVLPRNVPGSDLTRVRQSLSIRDEDAAWLDNSPEAVKVMVLVHRMAAQNMGFAGIYAALNDNGSETLKNGLLDGSAWVLRPFMQFILPLVRAAKEGDDFAVMRLLRSSVPGLQKDRLTPGNARQVLEELAADVDELVAMMALANTTTRDVLAFVHEQELLVLEERLRSRLQGLPADADPNQGGDDDNTVIAFFAVPVAQMWHYENYVLKESPFDTHQGVKGAEFNRVMVVLDDAEANYSLFSYGKLFGSTPLSDRDRQNIDEGKESVIDRTIRLFYVCCSRAVNHLAVVFYVDENDVDATVHAAHRYFEAEDVLTLADIALP